MIDHFAEETFAVFKIPPKRQVIGCIGGTNAVITYNLGQSPFAFEFDKYTKCGTDEGIRKIVKSLSL